MDGGADREGCPRCGESTTLAASACPSCRASLLVRAVLDAPVAYAVDRARLAQELSALGPPLAAPETLASELARARPVVARGLTRLAGRRLVAWLADRGLPCALQPDLAGGGPVRLPGPLVAGRRTWLAAAAALLVALLVGGVFLLWSIPLTREAVAKRALPSTVRLSCGDSVGTGFFVQARLLLTNAHVLCADGAPRATASDGTSFGTRLVKKDEDLDLAVLEATDGEGPPLPAGDATALEAGEPLVMVGTPVGLAHTVHEVKVSRVGQSLYGVSYLQIEGNVNPGNSGGPLVDRHGRVVGIVTLKVGSASGIGLALPINYATARSAFVPGPPEKDWRGILDPALTRFEDMVAAARKEDDGEVERMRHAFDAPGLADVYRGGARGEAAVVLVIRSPWAPVGRPMPLVVRRGGGVICHDSPGVDWRKAEGLAASESPFLRWLHRHGLGDDLWVGVGFLSGRGCPGYEGLVGAQVTLEQGDPRAASVVVGSR